MKSITALATLTTVISTTEAFAPNSNVNNYVQTSSSQLYGLFDGVKQAFTAPPASAGLDAERETPIDRWMGWNVKPMDETTDAVNAAPADFVDSMDESNYVSTSLNKPMGIVFEENDEEFGGIFVLSLSEGGAAETDNTIKPGDQLVAVNDVKVAGEKFDDALGTIVDATTESTKLVFFRGSEKQLYGPTGASTAWLDEFIAKESAPAK